MSKRKNASVSSGDRYDDNAIILKVASLIEEGSFGMGQIYGHYFADDGKGCCALGACYIGAGYSFEQAISPKSNLLEALGINTWPRIEYPKSEYTPFAANESLNMAALPDVIIFLNDRLGWSFSKIVNYLRDCTLPQATIMKVK